MKKLFFAMTAIVALAGGSATAADLPTKAPYVHKPSCAQFGGLYLGGHAGWGNYDHEWKSLDGWLEQTDDDFPNSSRRSKGGFMAGVQGGYNYQSGCTVFGIEVDYAWARINASEFYTADAPPAPDNATIESRLRGLGTIRTRTGLVIDNVLLYVTGGFAFADTERSWTLVTTAGARETFAYKAWRWGWTAGFGTEWALGSNLSLKSEVLYASFERDERTFLSAFSAAGQSHRFATEDSVWTTRIGLNYRFGGSVYAKN